MTISCFAAPPAMAQATAKAPEKTPEMADADTLVRRLPNGLTVLVKEDARFPLVSLRLYVHAGAAYERPEQAGISHVLEHMVFKGTRKRPRGAVAAEVEQKGGYLNAATSFDYTVYLTDMPEAHWKSGLDVLKDMAFHPSLDPQELESEKDVIVAELKRGEDAPGQRLFRLSLAASLDGSAYSRPIIGYENTVRGLSSEDIRAYIERLYQPQSMLLVVCGKVDAEEVMSEAAALFGDLKNSQALAPALAPASTPLPKGFTAVVEQGPWNKVHLFLSTPVPGMTDLRAAQLDLLTQLLGGDDSSRFYRGFKYEKRLVDAISVVNYSFEGVGLLGIQASLDADKLPAFWEALGKELAGLPAASFSKEELDRAKLNIEDGLLRSKETLSGYASKLGYFAFFDDGEQGERNYLRIIRDTDQPVLSDLLAATFTPEAFSLAVLLPKDAQAVPLPKDAKAPVISTGAGARDETAKWHDWLMKSLAAKWKAPAAKKTGQAKAAPAKQEVVDLGNGRTLVLIPDTTLPYVSANLLFSGGDSLLRREDQGLAAFSASLLTTGTKKLSAPALEDYLSSRAAGLAASAGRQTFSVSLSSPSRFSADLFALLQATLVTPAMKEEEAARVRENQIAAITAREDQPTGLAFRRMFPFLFGDHPYGFLQLGEKERVAKFSAEDAKAFWREQTLQPWVLSVCGDFDREAVIKAVKKLPVPAKKARAVQEPAWGASRELDLTLPGRKQAHLLMVFPTVGYGDADEVGIDLLQNILAGQSGLLFRDLRDVQGLGYTVTAFAWKSEKSGALMFYIGTDPAKLEQAKTGFLKVIAGLHTNPLPEEELTRGKNQMTGDYYREHQRLASRSGEAATLALLGLPLDFSRKQVQNAQNIDAATLQQLAQKYIQPEKAYTVTVLP